MMDDAATLLDVIAACVRAVSYVAVCVAVGAAALPLLIAEATAPNGGTAESSFPERSVRIIGLCGAIGLLAAHMVKLYLQAASFVDPGASLAIGDVVTMATATRWGSRWQTQMWTALAAAALFAWPRRGRSAADTRVFAAAVAALAIPATGHAAAHTDHLVQALAAQGLHVLAAALWFGTLGVLVAVLIRNARDARGVRDARGAHDTRSASVAGVASVAGAIAFPAWATEAWQRFSVLARVCAGVILFTGVVRALHLLVAWHELWMTQWGLTLIVKVATTMGIAALGWWNWHRVLPGALAQRALTADLRRTAGAELTFALIALVLTGWLAALPVGDR